MVNLNFIEKVKLTADLTLNVPLPPFVRAGVRHTLRTKDLNQRGPAPRKLAESAADESEQRCLAPCISSSRLSDSVCFASPHSLESF